MSVEADIKSAKRLAYLQLHLFCMRNFPYMQDLDPRVGKGKRKPKYPDNPELHLHLTELASSLGYISPEIADMKRHDPLESSVRAFVASC